MSNHPKGSKDEARGFMEQLRALNHRPRCILGEEAKQVGALTVLQILKYFLTKHGESISV